MVPERTSNSNNLSDKLKNAQAMKPCMWCTDRLKDIFIKISIVVEQFEYVNNKLKVDFFSIYFLVYSSYENGKHIIEKLRATLFQHFLGNGSNLRLVV
jgi:hypothetical protein